MIMIKVIPFFLFFYFFMGLYDILLIKKSSVTFDLDSF